MKTQRHAAILRLVRGARIASQEDLRERLGSEGYTVTQATLSRDIRELGLAKVSHPELGSYYAPPPESSASPGLEQLLPLTLVSADGVGPLLVLKTPPGAAQSLAYALDHSGWSELMGCIAGDDTILVIVRSDQARPRVADRLRRLAGFPG